MMFIIAPSVLSFPPAVHAETDLSGKYKQYWEW